MKTFAGDMGFAVRVRWLGIAAALAMGVALTSGLPARGATLADQAHSLRVVPADAAFYSASLRLQEQLDIFLKSQAYARLLQVPIVQLAKMQVGFQWQQSQEPAIVQFREYFQSSDGQDALALLKEMFADEMFCYGGSEVTEVLRLFLELNSMSSRAQLEALASGQPPEAAAGRMIDVMMERAEELTVPEIVFGFRIKDQDRATRRLDQIRDAVVKLFNDICPELSTHVQREQIAGHEFVTLRLDGSLFPWDEMRASADDIDEATFNKWKNLLSPKKLAVAIGVVDGFLLVSVGDSTNRLESYGQGPLLAGSADFARLDRHAGERLTSISYASAQLANIADSPRRNVEDMAALAEGVLHGLELDATRRDQILANVRGLAENLLHYVPETGSFTAVAFLTARGAEGFQYRSGTMPPYDSSQPLSIVDHLGGSPLLAIASRTKQTVEEYDQTVSWLKRVAVDVEQLVEEKAPPENWAEYQRWRPQIVELLGRCDQANREHLFPALADGQLAFVLDARATSDRWIAAMPPTEKPLPMLELGLVGSVSDVAHLRAGVAEYFEVVQDTISLLHEANPEEVPDTLLPRPNRETVDGSSLYVYPCPAEWGVDSQVALAAGATDSIWAASSFPASTARMLAATPLEIDTSLDVRRPAAMVAYFQLPALVAAIRPWIDYGFAVGAQQMSDGEAPGEAAPQSAAMMSAGFILPQVHQLLDVLIAVRGYSSVTYREEDVWVTHSELHVVDLE